MAVVQNTYTGDGTTVLYSLSFPYLKETDVKVSVNGSVVTNYIFATASSIQFLAAPANGATIRIYRETDIDDASATIFPGSAIKAQDLNSNFTQALYAVQESNFDADTATTTANTALTNSNTAISTANSAVSTANSAVSTANSAVSTANAASSAASAAVSTANTASSNATAAVNTANAASSAASSAVSTANAASAAVASKLDLAGGTMTGAINMGGSKVTNLGTPTVSTDATTKAYVDGVAVSGVSDGDKGDITVSGAGSIWTLDSNTITDAKVSATAAIDKTKISGTAITAADTGTVTSAMIADGTIVDGDVNASAAIAGSKISPNFGSQNVVTTGTVSGASLIPTGSSVPTNGVYLPSANNVAISTNGTGRLFVDSSGRVLVGTSTATSNYYIGGLDGWTGLLQVARNDGNGLALFTNWSTQTSYGAEIFLGKSESGTIGSHTVPSSGSVIGRINFNGSDGTNFRSAATISAEADGTFSNADSPGRLIFATTADGANNPTERMRIDSSGRVGIGTTSPGDYDANGDDLIVASSGNTGITIAAGTTSGESTLFFSDGTTGSRPTIGRIKYNHNEDSMGFFTADSERARIDVSGRLLVGTSSASVNTRAIFQATSGNSAGGGSIIIATGNNNPTNNGGIGYVNFSDNSYSASAYIGAEQDAATWTSGSDMPSRLVFSTTADGGSSPTERARIINSGFFKATNTNDYKGSTASYHELRSNANDFNALIVSHTGSSGNQYGVIIETANDQNDTTRTFLEVRGGATTRATIRSNGGIANYSANNVNLSDRNSKKDIALAADTWDCLKEWEIVNFRYKDQPDDADLNMGVIAQQVAESCPEVITIFQEAKEATETEPAQEERLGVKDQQMMWMAIKALQEAQTRIETLEAEVAALKAQ